MKYRFLGKTGIKVSVVGIETHQWSGMGGKFFTVSDIEKILDEAENLGINFIDTGECYFFHAAERLIGEALGIKRNKFVITTKFGHKSEPKKIVPVWTKNEIKLSLECSLRALNTDYIDIYQVHINSKEDSKRFLDNISDIRSVLKRAKNEGKIRSIGICLGDDELFGESGEILNEAVKMLGVEVVHVVYNRLDHAAEKNILPIVEKFDLGVIARGPLAKGFLSSCFKPNNRNFEGKRFKMVEKIKKTELPPEIDLAEWAIAWCLKNPAISTVIPGCVSPEQLYSTARAVDLI